MRRVEITIVTILCLLFLIHAYHHSGYTEEDAFISFQYARNLASGNGLVFNPGEKVEGYTNFLWTVLMSLAFLIHWDIVIWAKFIGGLSTLATVLLLCVGKFKPERDNAWTGWLAAGYLLSNSCFVLWSVGGLETALFCLFVTAACLIITSLPPTGNYGILAGSILGTAALTRPEGILIFVTITGALFFYPTASLKKTHYPAAIFIPFLVVVIPHFIWRLSYYGYLLPNTFYAKVGTGSSQILRGLIYVNHWAEELMYIPVISLVWVISHPRSGWRRRALASVAIVYLLYIIFVGGDWMRAGRFIVPILPFCGLSIAWMISDLLQCKSYKIVAKATVILIFIIVITGQVSSAKERWKNTRPYSLNEFWTSTPVLHGLWFKRFAPEKASIATGSLGHITYYSELVVYDRLGLIDPYIAHQQTRTMGEGDAGHEKGNLDYILSREPTFMFGNDRLVDFQKHSNTLTRIQSDQYRESQYRNKTNSISIANNPEVRRQYRTIRVTLAGKPVQFQILKSKIAWLKKGAVFQALPNY